MPAGVRRGRTDIIRALGSLSEKFSKLKEPSQALRSKKNQRDFLPFLHVEGLQGKKGGGGGWMHCGEILHAGPGVPQAIPQGV